MALAKQNERLTYRCKCIIILKCKIGQINLATTQGSVIDPCCLFSCLHQPKFAFAGARTMRMRCWSPQHLHCIFPVLFTIATLRKKILIITIMSTWGSHLLDRSPSNLHNHRKQFVNFKLNFRKLLFFDQMVNTTNKSEFLMLSN